jgi:uncharacterized Zn finger protein (UPF0148 family)
MGTCPNCKIKVKVNAGKNVCPNCGIFFQVAAMAIEMPKIEIAAVPGYIDKELIDKLQKSIAESLVVSKRYLGRT